MQFNLFPFAVEALGGNEKIYRDLDRLYQSRKHEFYRAAKAHELYAHQIVTEGGLLQEEYCKKALDPALCYRQHRVSRRFICHFTQGWTYAYLFVRTTSKLT